MNNFHNEYSVIGYSSSCRSKAIWLWCFFLRNTKREIPRNCISRFFLCNYNEQGAKLSSFKKCQSYSIRFLNRTGLWNWHHYSLTVFGSLNQWVELKNLITLIHPWIIQSWSVKWIKWFTKKIRLQRKVHSKIRRHYLITLLNQYRPGQFSGNHNIYFNLSVTQSYCMTWKTWNIAHEMCE